MTQQTKVILSGDTDIPESAPSKVRSIYEQQQLTCGPGTIIMVLLEKQGKHPLQEQIKAD